MKNGAFLFFVMPESGPEKILNSSSNFRFTQDFGDAHDLS